MDFKEIICLQGNQKDRKGKEINVGRQLLGLFSGN